MKPTPLIPSLLAALVLLAATPQLRAEPAIALQCLVNAVDNDLGGLICEMQRWIQSTPDKSVPVPSSQDYFLVIGHPIQSQMVDGQAFSAPPSASPASSRARPGAPSASTNTWPPTAARISLLQQKCSKQQGRVLRMPEDLAGV